MAIRLQVPAGLELRDGEMKYQTRCFRSASQLLWKVEINCLSLHNDSAREVTGLVPMEASQAKLYRHFKMKILPLQPEVLKST